MGEGAKAKVKFICYYLYNIDEICDKYNIRPKDC